MYLSINVQSPPQRRSVCRRAIRKRSAAGIATPADGESTRAEVAQLEETQIYDRIGLVELPHEEQDEAEGRQDGEGIDECRVEPVELIAFVEQDLQCPHPDDNES